MALQKYEGGKILGSPGWDRKFLKKLLDDKEMKGPRQDLDMKKMWPKVKNMTKKELLAYMKKRK